MAEAGTPRWAARVSMVGVSGVGISSSGGDAGGVHRLQLVRDRLGVGREVAVRAVREGVLAGLGGGEELLRLGAAHRAGGRGADAVVEAEALEDLLVGLAVQGVGLGEALVLGVEGVRVLHQELAAAQDAGPRAGLVAVLRLDLVEDDRQVLVGGRLVLHQEGEDLLVGRAEEVVAALAVLEAEQLGAVLLPAAGRLVRLPGQEARGAAPPGRRSRPSPRGRSARRWPAPSCRAAASSRCRPRYGGRSRRGRAACG